MLAVLCAALQGCGGSSNSNPEPAPPVDATPRANPDSAVAENGQALTLTVLANDSSPVGAALRVTAFSNPAHGVVTLSNDTLTYVPESGYYGQDEFTYTLSDSANRTATGRVLLESRISLLLRGSIDGQLVGAQLRLTPNSAAESFSSSGGLYSVNLSTSNADSVVRLEALGRGSDTFVHYAVLLGTARQLLALAQTPDPQSPPVLQEADHPRLHLGTVGTAEYGMLRELASAEDLLDASKLSRLQAFVDGEALLERAVLIERAIRAPSEQTVANTLLLAADPLALSRLRSPTGSTGSGGVANESQIALAKAALRNNSIYYSSAQRLGDSVSWISNDPQNRKSRMYLVNRWSGARLDNHERLRSLVPGVDPDPLPLSAAVQVTRTAQQVVFSASGAGNLGERIQCNGTPDDCTVLTQTKQLSLLPFFDHYVRVRTDALFDGETTPRLLSDQLATLAPGYARDVPSEVLLSLCVRCSETVNAGWVTDRVQFGSDGGYVQNRTAYFAFPPASGSWIARPARGPALMDSVSGDQHTVDWVAESAGRGLAIITAHNSAGETRVVLSEWTELPATPPSLPVSINRCDPVVDGCLLGRSLSSSAVPGERLLLLPDGRYARSFDPALQEQPVIAGTWSLTPQTLTLTSMSLRDLFTQGRFLPLLQLPDNRWMLLETRQFTRMGEFASFVEFGRYSVPRWFRCQ